MDGDRWWRESSASRRSAPSAASSPSPYSYWSGIPVEEPVSTLQINLDEMLYHGPVEDGLYMLIANGVPDLAQGTKEERERKYMETIRRFPETFDPEAARRRRDGHRGDGRAGDPDAWLLPQADRAGLGAGRRRLLLQAPRHGTGNRRRGGGGALRGRLPLGRAAGIWMDTRPGATARRPSTTTGPSPGAASRGPRARSRCSEAGPQIRTPARTCGIASPARWSLRS